MKWLKWIGSIFPIILMGMKGGQKTKAFRRFGIPIFSVIIAFLKRGFEWKYLSFLLWIPILSMGYGENSMLMGWLGSDSLVRVVYGILLSLPLFFFGWRRGACGAILLAIAFSVRAGSLGYVQGFGDLLIEDAVRYSVLGVLVTFNIFVD